MKHAGFLLFMMCLSLQAWAWKPLFIGHRGCYIGVENTVEAYRNGVDIFGYDGLECDVLVTKDGQYVICHDADTKRLGGNLSVTESTLAQLQAETYTQTRGGVTYTGHICTVAEYLDICAEKHVIPVMELKGCKGLYREDMSSFPGLAKLIIDKGLANSVIILSSMRKSLEYVKTHYPQFKAQYLCATTWKGNESWCQQFNIDPSIQADYYDINTVNSFRKMGHPVAVWVVNSKEGYEKYGNMGTLMITTDYLKPKELPELPDIDWDQVDQKNDTTSAVK